MKLFKISNSRHRKSDFVKNEKAEATLHRYRLTILIALIICLSSLIISRLAYLQLSQFNRYTTLALKNQMSIIPLSPPRGIIMDKNGKILAENIPVYVLEVIPEHVSNMQETLRKIRILLPSITDDDIDNFKHSLHQNRSFVPIPLKLKLSQEEVAIFASHQYQFKGLSIKARLMRYYPLGEVTAHLLGYVGRINIQELQQVDLSNYQATNFIGKAGIEKFYENLLHGKVGYQQVETDVSGRTLRVVSKLLPISGEKLYLTIDARLQQTAFDAMKDKRGAVVVMSAKGGDVLAMVSSPSFDPNLFVNGISSSDYQKLAKAKERPLYNRAVRGLYPPASTIKPFVALAGLEKGVDTHFSISDPGWFKLPTASHIYRDWKKTGHGQINISRAIMVSCDTYFYQLGHKIGIKAIEELLRQFGFGQLTKIDLFEEAAGLVPNPQWKRATKGLSWYPGDTLISSIGQGFMLASPLQLVNATAALSQQGLRFKPHLLASSLPGDHEEQHNFKPELEKQIQVADPKYWEIIKEAMHSVITSNEGTGYRFGRTAPYSVAGKTGTAQVFSGRKYDEKRYEDIPEFLRNHSLFIAFAPVENPEVAIAVMVENDFVASNVARKVLDAYFLLKSTGATP